VEQARGKYVARAETDGIERFAHTTPARVALLLVTGVVAWPLVVHAHEAFTRLRSADVRTVGASALLHVAMLVASALCWRRAFGACGAAVGRRDACVRYGVGTFLNAVTPARAGGAVRIGLFAKGLGGEGTAQRSAVALLGIGVVRAAAVTLLVATAALVGMAPRWLVVAPLAVGISAAVAHRRSGAVRAHLRAGDCAALFGWAALATCCRYASICAALVAVGVRSPVTAAVAGLVGLELSALIPLTPGLAGVGGAAVAVAIAAHGVPSATAIAGGVAFYVAEGGAGVAFGVAATAIFVATRRRRVPRDVPVPVW
jgi:uncharacterized membrane protein YbhN (UPF0104 family)